MKVISVGMDDVTILPLESKTSDSVAQMRLVLYYWNEDMRECIRKNLKVGKLGRATETLEEKLTKLKVRWHSVRRTGIQVYADCGVPLEKIRAITLHKDDETLRAYIGTIRPIVDRSKPVGMAISHAPFIWRIQNQQGGEVLKKF